MSLSDFHTAAAIASAVSLMRFDRQITGFEFSPSIGIAAKRMAGLADEFQDMREPLKKSIREVMTISILENFMSGGRPAWEELAFDTLRIREEKGEGSMILVRSGALAEMASSEGIWSVGKTAAVIKGLPSKVWYGAIHQGGLAGNAFGGGNWFKKYKSAARKVAGPDEDDEEVTKLAYKMFDQRLLKHGPAPRGTSDIPARPFVMFQDEDIDKIELIFVEWIEDLVREAGFA